MTREKFASLAAEKVVMLDGATGTELVKAGMPKGVCPELWVYENPDIIAQLHKGYREAGSDIVYAPTFGANRFKLEEFSLETRLEQLNITLAVRAKADTDAFVFGDLAPTGRFIEPFSDCPFEKAVEVYREQVAALIKGGVDGFVIETMIDIQETRAAILAVRSLCDLPVMVSVTFEQDGRTLNGTDVCACLAIAQSFDIDAFGCNCSAGPEKMSEWVRAMSEHARIPILAKPNAGLPKLVDGKTVFDMGPEEFSEKSLMLHQAGASIIGGCCGTTPRHIQLAAQKLRDCSPHSIGRPALLIANNRDAIACHKTSTPKHIRKDDGAGSGIMLFDSIPAEKLRTVCVARSVFPVLSGMPQSDGILRIFPGTLLVRCDTVSAQKVESFGHHPLLTYGINEAAIPGRMYDVTPLCDIMNVGELERIIANIRNAGAEVLCDFRFTESTEMFLLPSLVFAGLRLYMSDMEIAGKLAVAAYSLSGNDETLSHLVEELSETVQIQSGTSLKNPMDHVFDCVLNGKNDSILTWIDAALSEGLKAKQIIDDAMIPAINKVGEKYEKKIFFLPQLMLSAETMQKGFARLEPLLTTAANENGGTIVLATVKGDIHDIGKNIVALMLRNYSFRVIDLGKDVDEDTIINTAKLENADIIALSALMTTTMTEMKRVVDKVKQMNMRQPVMIGGAVVTQHYAEQIGAHYSHDAMEAVRTAQSLMTEDSKAY